MKNTKQFYFIKITNYIADSYWIGMDKKPTPYFSEANVYQGDPKTMVKKLIKNGEDENAIEVWTMSVEEDGLVGLVMASARALRIKSILED